MTDQPSSANAMPVSTCPRTDRHGYHMWPERPDAPAFCPGHPAPDNARTTADNPAGGDDGLREQIAAALEAADYRQDMRRGDLADAILPVVNRRMEQLAAGRDTWKAKAAEIEQDRDRLATALAMQKGVSADLRVESRARGEKVAAAEAAIARVRAIQPYTARTHGDRSQGYLLGWNAARDTMLAALDDEESPAEQECSGETADNPEIKARHDALRLLVGRAQRLGLNWQESDLLRGHLDAEIRDGDNARAALAQLHTWLTTNAAHHWTAAPLCRIPEAAQAHGGIAAGLDIAGRVVEGLIAGRGLPVSGRGGDGEVTP